MWYTDVCQVLNLSISGEHLFQGLFPVGDQLITRLVSRPEYSRHVVYHILRYKSSTHHHMTQL